MRGSALRAAQMASRYITAKQFKRASRELKFLRTRLGRLIRDRRKTAGDQVGKGWRGHQTPRPLRAPSPTTKSSAASTG